MKILAAAMALALMTGSAAYADAPPSHYDITPLTKADIDLYLSVMRPAAAYVQNPSPQDRAAIAYMQQNHGNPKVPEPPKVPQFSGPPTPAQMAALQKAMSDYEAKTKQPTEYMTRVATLASYDDVIAKQKHVEAQYDAVRDPVESAITQYTGAGASCGGDDCGPANPTATQTALWKKEGEVTKANAAFLKPYAAEIIKLRKVLHDVMTGK
jgi:hypothetical protein